MPLRRGNDQVAARMPAGPATRPLDRRRWGALALGLCLIAALLALTGPRALADTLRGASWPLLLAAAATYAAFFAARGARWALLLRGIAPRSTTGEAAALSAVGWAVSTFVPFKAGDIVRTAWMARRRRAAVAGVFGTVAVERSLDLLGLAATATASLVAIAWLLPAAMPARLPYAVALAWLLPIVAIAALAGLATWASRSPPRTGPLRRPLALVALAVGAVRPVVRGPLRLAILSLTAACALLQAGVYVFLLRAFLPGASWLLLAAAAPIFLLSFIIAVTPGHLGTYEAALVAILSLLLRGDASDYVAVAIATHVMTVTTVTALSGIGYLVLWWTAPTWTPAREPEAAA